MKSWNFTIQRILTRLISQKSLLKNYMMVPRYTISIFTVSILSKLSRKYQPDKRKRLTSRITSNGFYDSMTKSRVRLKAADVG